MKILITFTHKSTFVINDIDILKSIENNKVKEYQFNNSKAMILLSFIKQFFHLLFNSYDLYFCWFNDYHSLLPVLFAKLRNKKSLIVIGGYDALTISRINYGIYSKKGLRSLIADINCYLATFLCPVHRSCFTSYNDYIDEWQGYALNKTGYDLAIKTTIIPCGYDVNFWRDIHKSRTYDFMMVGYANNEQSFKRKGYPLFIELAKYYPSKSFLAIGISDKFRMLFPNNVTVLNRSATIYLRIEYSSSKYYLQLSLTESGPLTLREAIMCGCIPIVSNVPSMADCVPEKNVLRKPILSELVFIIESGLKYNPSTEKKVRENTLERRRNQLIKVIQ